MGDHHLVLGKLIDFVTGVELDDTHDERYRQKIAHFLVASRGFLKKDVTPRKCLEICVPGKKAVYVVDLVIYVNGQAVMVVKYGPGSMVTRYRSALAIARLVEKYAIPIAVVTNGEDVHVLETKNPKSVKEGFDAIPSKSWFEEHYKDFEFELIDNERAEMEKRVLFAYEVDDSCPCDDTFCSIVDG